MLATNDQILFTLNWFQNRKLSVINNFLMVNYPSILQGNASEDNRLANNNAVDALEARAFYQLLQLKYSK